MNNLIEENQKRLKFPFCAILLIVSQMLSFLGCISELDSLSIDYWINMTMLFVMAVILLTQKRRGLILVPLGVLLVSHFISFVAGIIPAFGGLSFYVLFADASWMLLGWMTMILLVLSNFNIPAIKNKKKIILIVLSIIFVFCILTFLRNAIAIYTNFDFYVRLYSGLGSFLLDCVAGVTEYVALWLIGFYIANLHKIDVVE